MVAPGCWFLLLVVAGCSWLLFVAGWLLPAAAGCCRLPTAGNCCWQLLTAASCYWLLPLATAGSQQKSAAGTNRGSSGQLVIESAKQLKAERQQGEQGQHETTVPAGVARSTRGSRQMNGERCTPCVHTVLLCCVFSRMANGQWQTATAWLQPGG